MSNMCLPSPKYLVDSSPFDRASRFTKNLFVTRHIYKTLQSVSQIETYAPYNCMDKVFPDGN